MTSSCPSSLALERFASGETSRADLKAHVAGCAKCTARLDAMERQLQDFSQSTASLDARAAFRRADARWKRRAAMIALVPVAAAAAIAALPFVLPSSSVPAAPVPVASVQPPPKPVQARAALPNDVLEPRGTPPPSRLRELSVRGRSLAFGEGALEAASSDEGPTKPFVLRHTDVRADVTGFVSSVTVTQEFENPFSTPVDAVYVFPLPEDAAVDELTLTAGSRVIRATIQKRAEARRMYEQAKAEGRRAALLDQQRPNIFTQTVANLLPGERVKVSLKYVAPLKYDDGQYTFNFPMTVAPRFADADRVSPPQERSGRDIAVTVHLVAGAPVTELSSVSHRMHVARGEGFADITLDAADRVPNKDFILRWRVTGDAKRAAVISSGGSGGTFALMVLPQAPDVHVAPVPKELVFVIDTSCSMAGPPLAAAKRAMRSAMEQMNPDDTFMLIDFADRASSFHDTPLPNTPQHVGRALAYLAALPAAGGTNQLAGLERALTLPAKPGYLREVLLMTDGFIGNETEIFAAAERHLGGARIFGFGVGSSVNHYLLSRLSQVGRGFYQYVRPDEDPEPAVERFVRRIEKPLLTDLSLQWTGVEVVDVLPRKVPDLFDAQPVVLIGRYREPGRGRLTLSGMRNGGEERLDVTFEIPAAAGSAPGLTSLWARARIEELDMMQHAGERDDVVREITTLGLEHHLVTKYTSFVAVDRERVTGTPAQKIDVPAEVADQTKTLETGKVGGTARPDEPVYFREDGEKHAIDGKISTAPGSSALKPPPAKPDPRAAMYLRGYQSVPSRDDEFATMFGGAAKTPEPISGTPPPPPAPRKTVYVPPAPGSYERDTREPSDVMRIVQSHLGDIKQCVEQQRRLEPGKSGKLVMKWRLNSDGSVDVVQVQSDDQKTVHLASCLQKLIRTWRFSPGSPAEISFPFKF